MLGAETTASAGSGYGADLRSGHEPDQQYSARATAGATRAGLVRLDLVVGGDEAQLPATAALFLRASFFSAHHCVQLSHQADELGLC